MLSTNNTRPFSIIYTGCIWFRLHSNRLHSWSNPPSISALLDGQFWCSSCCKCRHLLTNNLASLCSAGRCGGGQSAQNRIYIKAGKKCYSLFTSFLSSWVGDYHAASIKLCWRPAGPSSRLCTLECNGQVVNTKTFSANVRMIHNLGRKQFRTLIICTVDYMK